MIFTVRVVPRSGRTGFHSLMANGHYKLRLRASPVDGRANAELVGWLAGEFSVPRERVIIRTGATSRRKTLEIVPPASSPEWFHG